LILLVLTGCGTYRSGSGGYRGVGDYRTASDYSEPDAVQNGRDQIGPPPEQGRGRPQYLPRGEFKLSWPVREVRINRGFRPADDVKHSGLDLGGPRGTPILAAHEGVVIYAGRDFKGYGKMILIEYDKEWATLYGHLNSFAVKENTVVRAGDPIGAMGSTGRATGVHLHFELIRNQQPIDPLQMLTKRTDFVEKTKLQKRRRARR